MLKVPFSLIWEASEKLVRTDPRSTRNERVQAWLEECARNRWDGNAHREYSFFFL